MANLTERDKYNYCVQSFVDHHYGRAWILGNDLAQHGTRFPIYAIVLLSAQHLRRPEVGTPFAEWLLQSSAHLPWEYALVQLLMRRAEPQTVLSSALSNDQKCQAHYYIGARLLVEGNLLEAQRAFQNSLQVGGRCVEYDIAELELQHFKSSPTSSTPDQSKTVWDFQTLLQKLKAEHHFGYVYRGQNQHYGTLLTSGYRTIVDLTHPIVEMKTSTGLYRRGTVFRPLLANQLWPEAGRKRIDFVSLCRAQFGYLISQLFCQHCCLPTEGLDVTDEVEVAALFAIYDYGQDHYIKNTDTKGVMFRIAVNQRPSLTIQQVKETDFYSCPFFISGTAILNLLAKCETEAQARSSFAAYFREAARLDRLLDADKWRTQRPLQLLKLPSREINAGRISMQHAGLIFPDVLLPRWYDEQPFAPPPGRTWDGPQCVEELMHNSAIETFYFRHDLKNETILDRYPYTIFPKDDPLRRLLSQLITAISAGHYGVPTIVQQDTSVFTMGDEENLPR